MEKEIKEETTRNETIAQFMKQIYTFYRAMFFMFKSGIMGVSGAVQYGIMNGVFGCIAFYNAKNL